MKIVALRRPARDREINPEPQELVRRQGDERRAGLHKLTELVQIYHSLIERCTELEFLAKKNKLGVKD